MLVENVYKYVDIKASPAMLVINRSAGIELEMNLMNQLHTA